MARAIFGCKHENGAGLRTIDNIVPTYYIIYAENKARSKALSLKYGGRRVPPLALQQRSGFTRLNCDWKPLLPRSQFAKDEGGPAVNMQLVSSQSKQ